MRRAHHSGSTTLYLGWCARRTLLHSVRKQSNVTDQCLDITLTEDTAPGRHKPSCSIKDTFGQFLIVEAVGFVGVGVVHRHDPHEVGHDAITITLYTVTDLTILLIELHANLGVPHQVMFGAAQKAQVGDQRLDLWQSNMVAADKDGRCNQLVIIKMLLFLG